MDDARKLPKIVMTYNGLLVNDALLRDREWITAVLSHRDEDGEPCLRLSVYPALTGQVALDFYLATHTEQQSVVEEVIEACVTACRNEVLRHEQTRRDFLTKPRDGEAAAMAEQRASGARDCEFAIRSLDRTRFGGEG